MIKFKDFITSYKVKMCDPEEKAEPIEIYYDKANSLFGIELHKNNKNSLKKIVSEEIYDSYVEEIWVNQNTGRIGIALTNELDKNDD